MITQKRSTLRKGIYTASLVVVLCIVFIAIINQVYLKAENEANHSLHIETKQIKEDLNLQIKSDSENIYTMANFASQLYERGEDFNIILNAYNEIGLIERITILLPDNTLITQNGSRLSVEGKFDFAEESRKSPYTSGIIDDFASDNGKVILTSSPIIVNGETVAILYGRINETKLYEKYLQYVQQGKRSVLWIVDRETGKFILNTADYIGESIDNIENAIFADGYSYSKLKSDILSGNNGYSKFKLTSSSEYMYAHYSQLEDIGNWEIVYLRPESIVFETANETRTQLFMLFILVTVIMIIYIILLLSHERKSSQMNFRASQIRKQLLGTTLNANAAIQALENLTKFTKSRSAFFIDTDGENYNFIMPKFKDKLMDTETRDLLTMELLSYAAKSSDEFSVSSLVYRIIDNKKYRTIVPNLCSIMNKAGIKTICYSVVTNKKSQASVIGLTNPRNSTLACKLIKEIAICFSMSIFNRKYLNQTEEIATTDSLTGLFNRMKYKKDLSSYERHNSKNLSCVYIDIDGLHIFNNKFGHNAGDGMLLYIANAAKKVFSEGSVYRMGGDEYVVFNTNVKIDDLNSKIKQLHKLVEEANYHISSGVSYSNGSTPPNVLIEIAEKKMYEEKARYYQAKDMETLSKRDSDGTRYIETGIRDLNEALVVMSKHYLGIYCVSLSKDNARRIFAPNYLKIDNDDSSFKEVFMQYINTMVDPDYHRAITNFANYEFLEDQLQKGYIPSISYEKIDGERIKLTVYGFSDYNAGSHETIWIFEIS